MPRTPTLLRPHIQALIDVLMTQPVPSLSAHINGPLFPWPVGDWSRERGIAPEYDLVDPPYVNIRKFPSAGDFEGPLDDSQADIKLRVQIQAIGETSTQAVQVMDLTREVLATVPRSSIVIANRKVMDLRLMVVSGGVSRDDDLPTPLFYDFDIYELWTTPSTS